MLLPMPDHLHVIISPGESNLSLSKFLNTFKGRTTTIIRKMKGFEKIWQRSAFDHIIRAEEGLKAVIEYIMNNPVRNPKTEIENCFPGKSPSPCGRGRGGGVTLKVNYSPSP